MPLTYDELEAQARELTKENRTRLAQALTSSLSAPRSHEELLGDVKKITEGRIGFTVKDRERLEDLLMRPLRVRDQRIGELEGRLGNFGARLEELEAQVADQEAD